MQVIVNNESLKSIAEKLVARLNALGIVTKEGKPVVIDQGFEAIAAIVGYRNQHVLRKALEGEGNLDRKAIRQGLLQRYGYRFELSHSLDAWVVTHNGVEQDQVYASKDQAVVGVWQDVVGRVQAARYLSDVTWNSLAATSQEQLVTAYLQSEGWSPDLIPQLQAAGYRLSHSDFKRPYWELGPDASDDFDTDEQAWMDAWAHAKANHIELTQPSARSEMDEAIEELVDAWADGDVGGQHPHYDREDWQYEVSNGDTNLGYWEWVVHKIEANGGNEEHCYHCGAPLNDGEGADGLCGDCADKVSCSECGEALPEGHDGHVCPDCQIQPADIDRRTRTDYSFSIGALSRENLLHECADQGIYTDDLEREPSEELRYMLLEVFDNALRQAADRGLDDYFAKNPGQVVAARNGWEVSEIGHSTLMQCTVFLENPEPEQPSIRVKAHLELVGFDVTALQVN